MILEFQRIILLSVDLSKYITYVTSAAGYFAIRF